MNILVTGASGFIGSHVTQQLRNQGHLVKALVTSYEVPVPQGVLKVKGDLLSASDMQRCSMDCDAIIHCAGIVSLWHRRIRSIYEVNYKGTFNLLQAAEKNKVRRFVFVSTAGITGDTGTQPVNESVLGQPAVGGAYFRSKQLASSVVAAASGSYMDTVVVYPGRVYGPPVFDRAGYLTDLIENFSLGKWHIKHPAGNCICSYGYVEDIADGIIRAMLYSNGGEHYFLGGENVSNDAFFEALKILTARKPFMLSLPHCVFRWFAQLQEIVGETNAGFTPMFTSEVVERMFYNSAYDSTKAVNQLGFRIRPLLQGLQETLEYFSQDVKRFSYA